MNRRSMRLLYFINIITNSGGMERIVIDKINYFVDVAHFDVALCYFGSRSDAPFYTLDKRVTCYPIEKDYRVHSIGQKLSLLFYINKEISRIICHYKPDVLINVDMSYVKWLLTFRFRSIPKLVELHFSYKGMMLMNEEHVGKSFFKQKKNIILRRICYSFYNKCVVLTEADRYNWRISNIAVIPNFTNLQVPESDVVHNSCKTVINIGRLFPQKNHSLLLDAWKIVHQEKSEWKLEIWGEGILYDLLKNKIESLNLSDSVFLMGVSTHVEDVYNRASFFVLSSKYEGLPLVLIEAMQFGLPCVSFSIDGTSDIIKDGENGILIDKMNAESLADGIIRMIDSKSVLQMSNNAKKTAKAFSKEKIMNKWITLFNSQINIQG